MSLQDDLMRNRRIFELLTGESRERDASYRPQEKKLYTPDISRPEPERSGFAVREGSDETRRARAGFSPPGGEAAAVSQTARALGFSLNYGTVDLPAGFSNLPGIGGVTYPEIMPETARTAKQSIASQSAASQSVDPLESIYERMETEARMSSQLSREEGFFGY